jgi:hypothetical protein
VADPNLAPELRPGRSQNRWANVLLSFIATAVVAVLAIPAVTSIPERNPARVPLLVIVTTVGVISGAIVSISAFGMGRAKTREMAPGYTTLRVVIPGVWQLDFQDRTGGAGPEPHPSAELSGSFGVDRSSRTSTPRTSSCRTLTLR